MGSYNPQSGQYGYSANSNEAESGFEYLSQATTPLPDQALYQNYGGSPYQQSPNFAQVSEQRDIASRTGPERSFDRLTQTIDSIQDPRSYQNFDISPNLEGTNFAMADSDFLPSSNGFSDHFSPSTMQGHLSPSSLSQNAFDTESINDVALSQENFQQNTSFAGYSLDQRPALPSLNVSDFGNTLSKHDSASHLNNPDADNNIPPHMPSPIIQIDEWTDVQASNGMNGFNLSRSHSRRSQGGRQSNTHLSPFPADDEGEDDGDDEGWENQNPLRSPQLSHSPSIARSDDGSWVQNPAGYSGVSPIERLSLNDRDIPTLDEHMEQRRRAERNADVENWLTTSAEPSDNEGASHSRKRKSRPRARSTNDIAGMRAPDTNYGYQNVPSAPGPGKLLEVHSDGEDDDDGSYLPESDPEPTSPPADVQSRDEATFASELPGTKPWVDLEQSYFSTDTADCTQPYTANQAIMTFRSKAREVDTASLAATIDTTGSRRRSMTDMESLFSQGTISQPVNDLSKVQRNISNFVSSLLPGRTPSRSNSKKRKSNAGSPEDEPTTPTPETQQTAEEVAARPRRKSSVLNRPRTPRLDTNVQTMSGEKSPMLSVASAAIGKLRSRSKSDIGRSGTPGLAQLWTQNGGPPVMGLPTTPSDFPARQKPKARGHADDSDDEDADANGIAMDMSVKLDMTVIPTVEGFQRQLNALNPHLDPAINDRLVQEQHKRYKRLVETKIQHGRDVFNAKCSSKTMCTAMGGQPQPITVKPSGKNPDAPPVIFQIPPAGTAPEAMELFGDNQAAQFPHGVPLPPVQSLPAKFECPYCFKVKEFKKPSDWTKHVHEDIQPFTCTFPDCNDAKSFKRKADWVRHESERHRQLESWQCSFEDCSHVCYRRDNFVQHLVREHKVPEPKIRTGRNTGNRSPNNQPYTPIDFGSGPIQFRSEEEINEYVADLVEKCRHDSAKSASDEPCRFCGNICPSFKKLTVHLAKHMEQIAMPIIPLIEQHPGARDTFSPHQTHFGQQHTQHLHAPQAQVSIPEGMTQFFVDEPSEMDGLSTFSLANTNLDMTYPPMNMSSSQLLGVDSHQQQLNNFVGASYPPANFQTRSRGSSFNSQQQSPFLQQTQQASFQENTYPPAGFNVRGAETQQQVSDQSGLLFALNQQDGQQQQYGNQQGGQNGQQQYGSPYFNGMGTFNQ